jgi:hypothetical protein
MLIAGALMKDAENGPGPPGVLSLHRDPILFRVEPPAGSRLEERPNQRRSVVGVFTREGEFVFEVARARPLVLEAPGKWIEATQVEAFLHHHEQDKNPARAEQAPGKHGPVGLALRKVGTWPERWIGPPPAGVEAAGDELLVFSPGRGVCLRFHMRPGSGDRLRPAALAVLENGEVLSWSEMLARSRVVNPEARARNQFFLWTGAGVLGGFLALFVLSLYLAVYVQVMRGSQGMPVPQPIDDPCANPAVGVPAGDLLRLQSGLIGVGFEPAGWFYMDDVGGRYVGAWRHRAHPAAAFILFQPGGKPRVRILRLFPDGVILTTTNRLVDLASYPAASMYLQMRRTESPAELWSWHLEAEALFPQQAPAPQTGDRRIVRLEGDYAAERRVPMLQERPGSGEADPMEVFCEAQHRRSWGLRGRRRWLLHLSIFRECVRMYFLPGVSVKQQIEDGWAVAPDLRQRVCLPAEGVEDE